MPYVHMLVLLARAAARRGILIVLQARVLSLYSENIGLWYSYGVSEDSLSLAWGRLARALCNEWNVMGVDLQE